MGVSDPVSRVGSPAIRREKLELGDLYPSQLVYVVKRDCVKPHPLRPCCECTMSFRTLGMLGAHEMLEEQRIPAARDLYNPLETT